MDTKFAIPAKYQKLFFQFDTPETKDIICWPGLIIFFFKEELDKAKKFYDKPIATVKSTIVSDPEIKNAVCMTRI